MVSLRRRRLHDRLAHFPDETGYIEQQERDLSDRRRELHVQIDALRLELGMEPGPRRSGGA